MSRQRWIDSGKVSFPDLLSPQGGGARRCFKSIRAGRHSDQYVVVEDHEAIGLRIDAGSSRVAATGDPRQDRMNVAECDMSQPGQDSTAAAMVFHWKPVGSVGPGSGQITDGVRSATISLEFAFSALAART